jgi:hypothetical protein
MQIKKDSISNTICSHPGYDFILKNLFHPAASRILKQYSAVKQQNLNIYC